MSLLVDCMIVAALLTVFGAVNGWILGIRKPDKLPPADNDEDADALPFGPTPRNLD